MSALPCPAHEAATTDAAAPPAGALADHQLRAVFAAALDPIVTIDAHGVIQAASDSVERVFGYSPAELIGRNVRLLMPEPYRSEHDGHLARYRRTGQTTILGRTREYLGQRKNGEVFPVEISVSRADPPGEAGPIFVGILRDVSDRKRLEEALRRRSETLEKLLQERTDELRASHRQLRVSDRFASIGTLAAGLGHDMSNVLLPVLCRLDSLEQQDLPGSSRDDVEAIRDSMEYLRQLTSALRLLTLDPEDAGDEDATDIGDWWSQVGSLFARLAPRSVRLWCELPDDLSPVRIAPHQLTQAALNLIVNACEAVGEEGLVRVWAAQESDDVVAVGVSDNGPGMPPEIRKRAFDPFFTTKTRGLSTGLGLAIVHSVVRKAGGDVEIESEEGRGATVVMRLPVAQERAVKRGGALGRAGVALADERAAAYAATVLEAIGFDVEHTAADRPNGVDLWVTEASEASHTAARRLLRAKAGRSVVCLLSDAQQASRWRDIGAHVCDPAEGLAGLRSAIQRALRNRKTTTYG